MARVGAASQPAASSIDAVQRLLPTERGLSTARPFQEAGRAVVLLRPFLASHGIPTSVESATLSP